MPTNLSNRPRQARGRTIGLRLITTTEPESTWTGVEVLQEGARMLGAFLTQRLADLRVDDPQRAWIEEEASRLRALGDLCSPPAPVEPQW